MEQSNRSFWILGTSEDYDVIPSMHPADPTSQPSINSPTLFTADVFEQLFHNPPPPPMPRLSNDTPMETGSSGVAYDSATSVTNVILNELNDAMLQVRDCLSFSFGHSWNKL